MYDGGGAQDSYAQWDRIDQRNPHDNRNASPHGIVEGSGNFQPPGWGYDDEDSYDAGSGEEMSLKL